MEPDQLETSRLELALNKVQNIEEYMQVLKASLKHRKPSLRQPLQASYAQPLPRVQVLHLR